MAETIVGVIAKKIGRDIRLLKIANISVIADYFVLCTANSATQIKSLCDEVEKTMEDAGERILHREGYREGGWVLLDFGCVVVHVFLEEARQFYSLERLWQDAEDVDISALVGER
jgi:ribosome-associated protein